MKGQAAHHQIHKIQILHLLNITGILDVRRIERLIDIKPGNIETILTQMQKAGKIVRSGNHIALDIDALTDMSPASDAVMNHRVFLCGADFHDPLLPLFHGDCSFYFRNFCCYFVHGGLPDLVLPLLDSSFWILCRCPFTRLEFLDHFISEGILPWFCDLF